MALPSYHLHHPRTTLTALVPPYHPHRPVSPYQVSAVEKAAYHDVMKKVGMFQLALCGDCDCDCDCGCDVTVL